jgi:hypothetical protein
MPWTYSWWIRAFSLIRDDMPAPARERWTVALTLGYQGIRSSAITSVHSIPTHHAIGLYLAGHTSNSPEWREYAAGFLGEVINAQSEGGYWPEGAGPVVRYNTVYLDALGVYYALPKDQRAHAAIDRSIGFHYNFRYPDGTSIETIDDRNPYSSSVDMGNVAFTFTLKGHAYLAQQWSYDKRKELSADLLASMLLYGEEVPIAPVPPQKGNDDLCVLSDDGQSRAAIVRKGPWTVCLSAYTDPLHPSRWIQDRQNLISIHHRDVGLILGGGNTRLQPRWSNFTVGDPEHLVQVAGDENPDYFPKGELYHVPSKAELRLHPQPGLELEYGLAKCRLSVRITDDSSLEYTIEASPPPTLPTTALLTLIPHMGKRLSTQGHRKTLLDDGPIDWSPREVSGGVMHAGYHLKVPSITSLHWPALPHNPYRKDGHTTATDST